MFSQLSVGNSSLGLQRWTMHSQSLVQACGLLCHSLDNDGQMPFETDNTIKDTSEKTYHPSSYVYIVSPNAHQYFSSYRYIITLTNHNSQRQLFS